MCCKAVHALIYKKGQLEAYIVKSRGKESPLENYERILKETLTCIYMYPECNLKFTLDYERNWATPLPEEAE